MRLARLATVLLLGSFIGFSTTCGGLDLGGRYRPFAAEGPPPGAGERPEAAPPAPDFAARRARMVRLVEEEARLAAAVTDVPELDPRVLAALGEVPRHAFVPAPLARYAYLPLPLPVHPEQRLAAPFLVALMTHLAQVEPGDRVLETGTGEGYHAAVLARLGAEVFSVELLP